MTRIEAAVEALCREGQYNATVKHITESLTVEENAAVTAIITARAAAYWDRWRKGETR
jgi:hypothetical protein